MANTHWGDNVRSSEIDPDQAPTNTQQDRRYLCLTKTEYDHFAEAIQTGCYLNKQANLVKLKNTKTKKLKNLRYSIRKYPYIMQSMIWQAQLRIIEIEIRKRQHALGGRYEKS